MSDKNNTVNAKRKRHIFIVSDATGLTCQRVVDAALTLFDTAEVTKKKCPNVRTQEQIKQVIDEAAEVNGVVVYTIGTPEGRQSITELGRMAGVPTIDILGPLLTRFSDLLEISPLAQPGLGRQLDDDYFRRIEAIDYSIKHDDGLRMGTIDRAEIVLLGVSRTTKTPVSIYLSYRGWKVANIPIIHGQPLPQELEQVDRRRVVALTVKPARLLLIRMERQKYLKDADLGQYTDPDEVKDEVNHGLRLYREYGCPVLDVTYKSIEETSTEVMRIIYSQTGLKKGNVKEDMVFKE